MDKGQDHLFRKKYYEMTNKAMQDIDGFIEVTYGEYLRRVETLRYRSLQNCLKNKGGNKVGVDECYSATNNSGSNSLEEGINQDKTTFSVCTNEAFKRFQSNHEDSNLKDSEIELGRCLDSFKTSIFKRFESFVSSKSNNSPAK